MKKTTHNWNNALKIAIVNEEIDAIARLHGELPAHFENAEDAKEASALIAEAIRLLRHKRDQIQRELEHTKNAIIYQKNQLSLPISGYKALG
jgi:hypothetical protein